MRSTNTHLEEHLEHVYNKHDGIQEQYYQETQDRKLDTMMEQWHDNQCTAAHQMRLISYDQHGPILDEYDAYWSRLELYFIDQNEEIF